MVAGQLAVDSCWRDATRQGNAGYHLCTYASRSTRAVLTQALQQRTRSIDTPANPQFAELIDDKAPAITSAIPRRHDLDALRAVAMLLGIVLHGALAYIPLPEEAWPVQDVHQHDGYGVFLSAVHGFRMPLFFLVSGFFTAMLWRKRGLAALVVHRLKRILLPLVIGMFTIVPAVWIVSIGAGIVGYQAEQAGAEAGIWSAATSGDVERVRDHLARGVSPSDLEPVSGATPLSLAAGHGQVEVIQALLAAGVDVNVRNRDGATPIHAAAMFGQADAARILIEHGADPDKRNRTGETARDMLHIDGMRMLVMAEFNGLEVDREGRAAVASILRQAESTSAATDDESTELPQRPSGGLPRGLIPLLLTLLPVFHHLWFLNYLCWLVAAFAIYALVAKHMPRLPAWLVTSPVCYVWLIALTALPQSMMGLLYPNFGPDTSVGLLPMPSILSYYAIFFFFGAVHFDASDEDGRVGRWWRVTLPVALLVVFPLGFDLTMGGLGLVGDDFLDSGWCRPLAIVLQAAYAWLMTFGLMGLFRDLLSQQSNTARYVSDSSYWLYLTHLPVIMVAQAVVRDWPVPSLAKLALVCALTTGLLLACYQLFVRYTFIGTLLNGPRQRPTADTAEPPRAELTERA